MGLTTTEIIFMSLNASVLAILYTIFGAFISYLFYHIFDDFDEKWKKRSELYKFADVLIEIVAIALAAFWSSQIIQELPPFFKVKKALDIMVDSYISGIFFIFAMFLFLDELTEKLKFLHDEYLGGHLSKILPQHGHLLDLSLSYTLPKTKTN
jgi:H+/Cl- antiporter ClcA